MIVAERGGLPGAVDTAPAYYQPAATQDSLERTYTGWMPNVLQS